MRNLRNKIRSTVAASEGTRELTAERVSEAETIWIKSVQTESFKGEVDFLRDRKRFNVPRLVQQFGLFLDEKNVLRCEGRVNESKLSLSAKLPALLPSKHWFTD